MIKIVKSPTLVKAAGTKEKIIREYIGNVNTGTSSVSLAMMKSPEGWEEPGQVPEFDEYTLVLKGKLLVKTRSGEFLVSEGEAVIAGKGEWVRYGSPEPGGAEYIAVCVPAFSPATVNRDVE